MASKRKSRVVVPLPSKQRALLSLRSEKLLSSIRQKRSQASSSLRPQRASVRSKDKSPKLEQFTSSWQKVYWLLIDYLEVAKEAMRCGSYFTAVLYAELWCEEHFTTYPLAHPIFLTKSCCLLA